MYKRENKGASATDIDMQLDLLDRTAYSDVSHIGMGFEHSRGERGRKKKERKRDFPGVWSSLIKFKVQRKTHTKDQQITDKMPISWQRIGKTTSKRINDVANCPSQESRNRAAIRLGIKPNATRLRTYPIPRRKIVGKVSLVK